jgi:Na+-transporting NADH:ubiquinone oxidoreductase subunit NqrD
MITFKKILLSLNLIFQKKRIIFKVFIISVFHIIIDFNIYSYFFHLNKYLILNKYCKDFILLEIQIKKSFPVLTKNGLNFEAVKD